MVGMRVLHKLHLIMSQSLHLSTNAVVLSRMGSGRCDGHDTVKPARRKPRRGFSVQRGALLDYRYR